MRKQSGIETIYGQHRSLALAERHVQELKRKYGTDLVRIVARRNQRGYFSQRGQFFTFEIQNRFEFVLHFDYDSKNKRHGKNLIRFQLHMIGPGDAKDNEAIAAAIAIELGVQKIEGWEFRLITWGHPPKPATNPWNDRLSDLYEAAANAGKRSVHSKTSIKEDRSAQP